MLSDIGSLLIVTGKNSVQSFSPEQKDLFRRALESFIYQHICLMDIDLNDSLGSNKFFQDFSDLLDLHLFIFGGFPKNHPIHSSVVRCMKKCKEVLNEAD